MSTQQIVPLWRNQTTCIALIGVFLGLLLAAACAGPDIEPNTVHVAGGWLRGIVEDKSELTYLFDLNHLPVDITGKLIELTAPQKVLADTMIRTWTQFAHTGDPNTPATPTWQRFDPNATTPYVQSLASGPGGIHAVDAVREHQCAFWTTFLE